MVDANRSSQSEQSQCLSVPNKSMGGIQVNASTGM